MPREVLRALAEDVDRLLLAGGMVAVGDERLGARGQRLRELGQKVPVLAQVADAVERVSGSETNEAAGRLLDLLLVVRQIQAGLTAAGAEGPLEPLPESGPWWTPVPSNNVAEVIGELQRRAGRGSGKRAQALCWAEEVDLRTVEPCLRALRGKTEILSQYDPRLRNLQNEIGVLSQVVTLGQFGPVSVCQSGKPLSNLVNPLLEARRETLPWAGLSPGQTERRARALLTVLREKDPRLRERAIRFLGRMARFADFVVPALTDILQGKHTNVRLAAAEALGEIGPAASIAVPILNWYATMEVGEVGEAAAQALASIQGCGRTCDPPRT
jgi:hypothetical protein